jgi:hypothetical protein
MNEPQPAEYPRREKRNTFLGFVAFSVFYIGYVFYSPPTFNTLVDWCAAGGAIFFPIMAIISFRSLRNDWSPQREDQATMRMIWNIVLTPVLLVGAVVAFFMLQSAFSWLAALPSGMAVVIVLLVLIYLRSDIIAIYQLARSRVRLAG